jgi:type I restriction enzyme M protein
MDQQIDLSTLESHLWEAANILRGPVESADFKTYVFPLLFFKSISDVFDEENSVALEESGGEEEYASFRQNYRFQIPNGCRWSRSAPLALRLRWASAPNVSMSALA